MTEHAEPHKSDHDLQLLASFARKQPWEWTTEEMGIAWELLLPVVEDEEYGEFLIATEPLPKLRAALGMDWRLAIYEIVHEEGRRNPQLYALSKRPGETWRRKLIMALGEFGVVS